MSLGDDSDGKEGEVGLRATLEDRKLETGILTRGR
jgi:hypothetical protein